MMKTSLIKCFSLLCTLVLLFLPMSHIVGQAQNPTVRCGDILESELLGDTQYQDITLQVQAGTKVDLSIMPLGSGFNPLVFLLDSGGGEIARLNAVAGGLAEEFLQYQLSSSNTTLRVFGARPDFILDERQWMTNAASWPLPSIMQRLKDNIRDTTELIGTFYGAFTISLGCTLRDGTVIEPGQTPPEGQPGGQGNAPTPIPADFVGFRGLPAVNFANGVLIPFNTDLPNTGSIAPGFDSVFGFNLDASAGDTLDLTFTRLSGNLNLGLVVLSADNQVVFQASLVTSTTLNTRFTLPTAGTYTIGVFRIDLLPPAAPEATAFQVQGTLNPS